MPPVHRGGPSLTHAQPATSPRPRTQRAASTHPPSTCLRRHLFRLEGELHLFEFSVPLVLAAARQLGLSLSRKQNDVSLLYLVDEALQDQYDEYEADTMRRIGKIPAEPLSGATLEAYSECISERRCDQTQCSSPMPARALFRGVQLSSALSTAATNPSSPTLKPKAGPMPADGCLKVRRRRRVSRPRVSVFSRVVEEPVDVTDAGPVDGDEDLSAVPSSDDDADTEEGSSSSCSSGEGESGSEDMCSSGVVESTPAAPQARRRALTFGKHTLPPRKHGISLLLPDDSAVLMPRPGEETRRSEEKAHQHGYGEVDLLSRRDSHGSLSAAAAAASRRSLAGTTRHVPAARGPLLSMLEGADWNSAAVSAPIRVPGF